MSLLLVQVSVQRTRSTQCQHLPDPVGAAPNINEATNIRLLNGVLSGFEKQSHAPNTSPQSPHRAVEVFLLDAACLEHNVVRSASVL